ncbi:ATP-dependent exoDNAse (exonuclease V) beta subunit (contains helicase and exonuclease domains) [Syntrophus gentianae]|uniref:DNA 3'-5' helicase n=1 Tax=Syntrophus gentianae TaxID=43775 RepID=A0A1H8AM40_9BACT|nr:UvrD-helicase domain-containing protein [Syntrophus gentianae]SEM70908.1 ATP-dependent exoDNAse (exonuclease V) beta subunit (contains helicase and exonuclease domains) [Syntrophus gentianae]
MVKSLFVTASAGSGKTFRLTQEVRRHIERDTELVVAATFTRAAAAEMEKRILEAIEKGPECTADKLQLLMRAARVHFSTIDALFLRFLSTESYVPQVADDHEKAIITALADERFFQHPRILADIESIVIAARILHMPLESLIEALDNGKEALEAWDCPEELLDILKGEQGSLMAEYEALQEGVQAVAEETKGTLRSQVVVPLLDPLAEVDLKRALFLKSDLAEVRVAAADRGTTAYATLCELYPAMRRLVARHLINTKRLRSALLKHFIALRSAVVAEQKERLGRLYFDDIPKALIALDGSRSPDRPFFMARLYELGFHRTAHLLLDEFQDTSQIQYDLLRPLIEDILGSVGENAEGERSIFLVGDWKQSIYQWRDAAPDRLRDSIAPAIASGQIAKETLPHNYRSTPLLIEFFNNLVAALFDGTDKVNLQASPKTPKHPYGGLSEVAVITAVCKAEDDPAYERLVATMIQKKEECGCPWGDMSVLCRTNIHMDKAAKMLANVGIPTSGIRGRELLSLREGTALYLSLIALFTGHDGQFIPRALASLGYNEVLKTAITGLSGTIGNATQPHRFASFASALRELTPHFPRVLIETLWDEAERYFDRPDAIDAPAFLRYLLTMSHLITVPEGEHADRVKLATIHGTKGLEFPHVFLFWKEERDRAPEIPHPDDGCPLSLSKNELAFLATGPILGATAIAEAVDAAREEKAEETANLLYVAASRAAQSLTIILRANGEGALKGFSELMLQTAQEDISNAERTAFGWRHDYGPERPRPADYEELAAPDLTGVPPPIDDEEMDPTLRSADIEVGIERGIRIHEALARLTGDGRTILPGILTGEEHTAVERFLDNEKVREILFRPGKVLTEQHLSDTRAFGIVDRLIIAPDRITLIDFKTGRVGHLADKYLAQMIRYRTILQGLFPGRPVECCLMFVDEPQRITMI